MQRKALLVFSDVHLPYSPSTLNLFHALRKRNFSVTLLAPAPEEFFSLQKVEDPDIKYINAYNGGTGLLKRIGKKVTDRFTPPEVKEKQKLLSGKAIAYIEEIKRQDADVVIAVDFFCLWCVEQAGKTAHLLSLEILDNDPYYNNCNLSAVHSVLIQSEERYNYLFGDSGRPPFSILPNSPEYIDFTPAYQSRPQHELVYCGSAVAEFGIFNCLEFLTDYPEYTLTIKGAVPPDTREGIDKFYAPLVNSGRLVINDAYVDPVELTKLIAGYRIGFAFYDFYRFPRLRRFNYYTAPSGKLYQYFNSGVPVIGNQLSGFDIVEKHRTGVLIPGLSSVKIRHAIDVIERDYLTIAQNAKQLSQQYNVTMFLDAFIDKYLSKS